LRAIGHRGRASPRAPPLSAPLPPFGDACTDRARDFLAAIFWQAFCIGQCRCAYDGREGNPMTTKKPVHPGEVLQNEFLAPLNLSAGALAKACGVPRPRIEKIVSQRIGVEAGTALRLARALGTTPELWLDL